jgi:energy-coupling factor transporter transmembrane protein EcfT
MIKILPGIILRNYKRSEETSKMMQLRGYGKQIPRGIVYPVQFTLSDGLVFLLITLSFIGVNFIAKI